MSASYYVSRVRNYDGIQGWAWGLYVEGELYHAFDTEKEAWAEADKLESYDQEEPTTNALGAEEPLHITQDRERNSR